MKGRVRREDGKSWTLARWSKWKGISRVSWSMFGEAALTTLTRPLWATQRPCGLLLPPRSLLQLVKTHHLHVYSVCIWSWIERILTLHLQNGRRVLT
jgi:hypothetical protein